jgi:hypothetical protein
MGRVAPHSYRHGVLRSQTISASTRSLISGGRGYFYYETIHFDRLHIPRTLRDASAMTLTTSTTSFRPPTFLDHILAFIYLAHSSIALIYEAIPMFEDTCAESLGDLRSTISRGLCSSESGAHSGPEAISQKKSLQMGRSKKKRSAMSCFHWLPK